MNSENFSTPETNNHMETESRESIVVSIEAEGDTTIRPMRSEKLRQIRPDQPPPKNDDDQNQ